jgi:hypothetical protein
MKFFDYPVEKIDVIKLTVDGKSQYEWKEPNPDVTKSTKYEAFKKGI